jgi:hypothetical protein
VSDVVSEDGSAQWVRVVGLDLADYLTSAEALTLAGTLTAAVNELAPPG